MVGSIPVTPPLAIDDNGDLLLFDSADEASSYIEAVDVRDGVYRGFDGAGRRLVLTVSPTGAVQIDTDAGPSRIEELRALLTQRLAGAGIDPTGLNLPALLKRAREVFRIL